MNHIGEDLLKYTAIYRCPDDISNLVIRFKIREDNADDWEEQIYHWQEKIFSKLEREFYKNESNCVTDLEKKYYNDIQKLPEKETRYDVYSYINDDDFTFQENVGNYLQRKVEEIQLLQNNDNESDVIVQNDTVDNDDDSYDFKDSIIAAVTNPIVYHNFEIMYIMADLGEYVETTWIKNETVLCILKFDKKSKMLLVYPDFSKSGCYNIEIHGGTAKKYRFTIENISKPITDDELFKEKQLMDKLIDHDLSLRKQHLNINFQLPPKNKLQVHLFFEILWAKQFEYDTVFIQYFIDLPKNWTLDDGPISGMSQTCHTKSEEGTAHFAHCFDVILGYFIEELETAGIPKCPYIYFEVISKDSWNRYRTEGLTYKNLPVAKPGYYRYELQCFRLVPDSISGQLRRFFIGDSSNYDDITWIGLPRTHEGTILNKYGTNTLGTGVLGIRMNVIHQSQAFLDEFNECPGKNREIFEKLNCSTLVKSVEQVLQAFRRARRNMIAARKNV